MVKKESNVKELARQAAKEVLDTAAAAAAALAATTSSDITYIKQDIKEIKDKLDQKFVTKEEFSTVKMITYGLVGLICAGVIGGLLLLLFKTNLQ